jgi:hypothetical protein
MHWPNIIRMIKSRWVRWALRIACMEDKNDAYRNLVGNPEGKRPLGRINLRGKMIIL